MAELHSNIYYMHEDPKIMKLLDSLFYESEGDSEKIRMLCESINPEKGRALSNLLIKYVDEPKYELSAESLDKIDGYSVCHFVHGSSGDEIVGKILETLYCLCPGIHAQAWGCGDDDPWEFWFKYENGSVRREDDSPEMDEDEDEVTKDTIYKWWHESMPGSIREGLLNEIDIEDEYIVFTGKMENGTREEMEGMAEEFGAIVQKSVNGRTTILVVGDKPGASKLNKAKELDVKIITELDFNRIVE